MGDSYRPHGGHRSSDGDRHRYERRYEDLDAPGHRPRYEYGRDSHPSQRYYQGSGDVGFDDAPEAPVRPPDANGDKDVSKDDEPSRLVLVRGLKSSIQENIFAKGLDKLYRDGTEQPSGATQHSLKRVLLIRDRYTDDSMGYGFAEYHEREDAQAAVARARAMGEKCTIGSQQVLLSFPHKGVFPHASYGRLERNEEFTIEMPNSQERHKYCDDRYYASELIVNEASPHAPTSTMESTSEMKKKPTKGVKRAMDTLESVPKKVKAADAAPGILQHWQKRTAELRDDSKPAAKSEPKHPASGVNTTSAETPAPQTFSEEQTFCYNGHPIACYLCQKQFKNVDGIHLHLKESELHAGNLANETAVQKGHERLKIKRIDPDSTIKIPSAPSADTALAAQADSSESGPKWRDRAAERRQKEEAEPTTETPKIGFSMKNKGLNSKDDNAHSSSDESAKPKYGKGMNMLQKHGWTEGEGLGSGGGITAPIEQSLYASGVGLGHQSSKVGDAVEEAERLTKNNGSDFLEKTRDNARKRYEEMQ